MLRIFAPVVLALATALWAPAAAAQPMEDPGLPQLSPRRLPPREVPAHATPSAADRAAANESVTEVEEEGPSSHLLDRVPAPTVTGGVGLLRLVTPEIGPRHGLRIGLAMQLTRQRQLLVASANGLSGDLNSRFLSNLTIGYSPWSHFELFLTTLSGANQNVRPETPPARTDPEVMISLGDVAAGAKGRIPVAPWFELGLVFGLRFFNSAAAIGVEGAATNVGGDLVGTFDLRRATREVPLRLHLGGGLVYDNSIRLLPEGQCAGSTSDDACIRSRLVETFAYGIGPTRLRLAAAIDAPLAFAGERFGLDLILEYHGQIALSAGDRTMLAALSGAGLSEARLRNRAESSLTMGLRLRPVAGLIVDLGLDVALASFGLRFAAPLPTWNAIIGLAYAIDPLAAGRRRTKVVTRVVAAATAAPIEGRLRGVVRDVASRKPLPGAIVRYVSRPGTTQLCDLEGRFASDHYPPGPLTLTVSHADYQPTRVDTALGAGGDTEIEVLLTPKPPAVGTVQGHIADAQGAPLRATVRLTSSGQAVVEPEVVDGAFTSRLAPGEWTMSAGADGYLDRQRSFVVAANRTASIEVALRKRPTSPHATLAGGEIALDGLLHFERGDTRVRADSEPLLDEVADLLAKHPELHKVLVEVHTDNHGDADGNLALTQRRAEAIVGYLLKEGVDAARLEAKGYGATRPLLPNLTPANRAKNRRILFKVVETAGR